MAAEILLAEDEPALREGLAALLASEGHLVRTAADGAEALARFREKRPDLVLLDVMMPRRNGWEVCQAIRQMDGNVPILFLTVKDTPEDELRGFGAGADDYIVKTAPEAVKLARVAAALRRTRPLKTAVFAFGAGQVDAVNGRFAQGGRRIELSLREVEILRWFNSHPNETFSRDELLARFWGRDFAGDEQTLSVALHRLRTKLGSSGACIHAVYGKGYLYRPL